MIWHLSKQPLGQAAAKLRDLKSKHQKGYGQPYFFVIFT
jgi:hypothetical protein